MCELWSQVICLPDPAPHLAHLAASTTVRTCLTQSANTPTRTGPTSSTTARTCTTQRLPPQPERETSNWRESAMKQWSKASGRGKISSTNWPRIRINPTNQKKMEIGGNYPGPDQISQMPRPVPSQSSWWDWWRISQSAYRRTTRGPTRSKW